jgi:serine/threonine protein kinase
VHQAGWWDDAPYLARELAPHGSLAARLAGPASVPSTPAGLSAALHLVEQVGEVLAYLHRQGVVHGNLKPSNVLFAADGIPRLVDFLPTGSLSQHPLRADDGDAAGLGYLAPELIQEPPAEPHAHTDIYGLGFILYELLTGRPAFAAASARAMRELVLTQQPVPPSQLNPVVTGPLEGVCLRCLQKNPWRRYHRAYDLIKRLRHFHDECT